MTAHAEIIALRQLARQTAAAFEAKAKHMPARNILAEDMVREIDTQMYAELAASLPRRAS
jgi:hypothetical protein